MKYNSLIGRTGNRSDHHPWLSRDYLDIDCRAIGCQFNKQCKCAVPSLCVIDAAGQCKGFKSKELPTKIDGD